MRTTPIALSLIVMLCVAAAPATAPSKRPTTYAEAMKEVARLTAEVDSLREEVRRLKAEMTKPSATIDKDEPIKVGMLLTDAEKILKNPAIVVGKDGERGTFYEISIYGKEEGVHRYHFTVQEGKVMAYDMRIIPPSPTRIIRKPIGQ